MSEDAVVFGQVFVEQRVDLRWPTSAGRGSATATEIAVVFLIVKETP
jgi:hypothetical protein